MPYVCIETRGDWIKPKAAALFAGVDAALVRVLKVPPADSMIRLICHEPELMQLPQLADPHFVFLQIALFPGRSLDAKRLLYQELTAAVSMFGVAESQVTIALHEIGLEDWGIGGRPASELQFSFPLRV